MKLTPLDIRHKEFKRGMRGYADVEVDEFLDEVADESERLFKENLDLRDPRRGPRGEVAGYQRIEETLQKTLVTAQASAEEPKQNASEGGSAPPARGRDRRLARWSTRRYAERQAVEQAYGHDQEWGSRTSASGSARCSRAICASSAGEPASIGRAVTPAGPISPGTPRPSRRPSRASRRRSRRPMPPRTRQIARSSRAPASAPRRRADEAPDRSATSPRAPWSRRRQPAAAAALSRAVRRPPTPRDHHGPAAAHCARRLPRRRPHGPPRRRRRGAAGAERILFGETDDLLADVDTGVNKNEFKW